MTELTAASYLCLKVHSSVAQHMIEYIKLKNIAELFTQETSKTVMSGFFF